ncbi:MAG: HD domain-containing protein [Spirochaetes bacterium]|jgi:putative hydrolase of HD superfamily|nr:HD domain-containing protein [Spirochaetota bacterium]
MIEQLLSVYRLKDEIRAGWVIRSVLEPESVADHSWGTALLCLLNAGEAGVDADPAIRMALVHDIAEAEVGDIPRRVDEGDQPVSRAEKARREHEAIARLAGGPFDGAVELWREYEAGETPVARFVRDMNLIDMCLQALYYERAGRRGVAATSERAAGDPGGATRPQAGAGKAAVVWEALDEFFATARPRVATAVGLRLFADIEYRYRALREER